MSLFWKMSLFRTDKQTDKQMEQFFKFLTYIDMTHVNFLVHRLLVSETQTDRQDKFVTDIYLYIDYIIIRKILSYFLWIAISVNINLQQNCCASTYHTCLCSRYFAQCIISAACDAQHTAHYKSSSASKNKRSNCSKCMPGLKVCHGKK